MEGLMPLGFPSINRGTIAFGFFNIDTDLLILEHYFLFAPEFCRYVSELVEAHRQASFERSWDVYNIENSMDIGDLMGAIHDIKYSGFIGEVYKRFPFPKREEDFKQKPEGFENRHIVENIIGAYATEIAISFRGERSTETIQIGEYLFSRDTFQRLIQYVWQGGYPRWKDDIRPAYVTEMKKKIEGSTNWLLAGIQFDKKRSGP
jgi:hypothetical protein